MDIPRELIYEDKKVIEDFGIDQESSLNYLIYEEWLLNQADLQPTKSGLPQRKLKVFNDAYYICTLILMHKTNDDFLSYAISRIEFPSIVFPMVYIYISKTQKKSTYFSRLLKTIKTAIKSEKWAEDFKEIDLIIQKSEDRLPPEFAPRNLSPEILSSISWYKTTCGYKEQDTLKLLKYISKSNDEWLMMIDTIENAAREYEWDYNQDLDYVDDDGNWCKDTPKNLKQFYQFCDEIREKYNDYVLPLKAKEKTILTEKESGFDFEYDEERETSYISRSKSVETFPKLSSTKIGRPKAKQFNDFIMRDTPRCFMPILHEMLDGETGKDAAKIIRACVGFWISEPQKKSVTREFGSIKPTSFGIAFNNPSLFTEEELEQVRTEIREK